MFYVNLMVTTEQHQSRETRNIKKGEAKQTVETLENHKLTKVDINRRKKTRERQNNQKAKHNIAVVNPYISVITLNVNRLNLLIKSQNGWID